MARQNPIADAMSAIKNAGDAGRSEAHCRARQQGVSSMLRVMQENGFIGGFEFIDDGRGGQIPGPHRRSIVWRHHPGSR